MSIEWAIDTVSQSTSTEHRMSAEGRGTLIFYIYLGLTYFGKFNVLNSDIFGGFIFSKMNSFGGYGPPL